MSTDAPAAPVSTQEAPSVPDDHKVFAGNLAYSTTSEGLKAFFAPVQNDVVHVQLINRGTRSAGYGFVSFSSADAARRAVSELHKKELDGRTVLVELAKPPDEKDKDRAEKRAKKRGAAGGRRGKNPPRGELADSDAAANGEDGKDKDASGAEKSGQDKADKSRPKKKRNPRKPRQPKEGENAAPTTNGDAAATGASQTEGGAQAKKPRAPKTPKPKPQKTPSTGEAPPGTPSKSMLFVANLGFNIDDNALSELFTSAGVAVTSARVVRRRWGQPRRSKGYGFVDVGSEENQKKAIELLQGKDVGGREIAVKVAVNQPDAEDGEGEGKESEKEPEAVVVAT